MPTQKKFLDQTGLIQLLQQIEGLDKTNVKDLYWSTDNADVNPTVVFKVGDDNGSPHSLKKLTFKGETGTQPAGATARTLTITIGGVDKTITYYDTDNSTGLSYSYTSDSTDLTTATTVKAALDRAITALVNLDPDDEKVKQTLQTGNTTLPILTAVKATPTSGDSAEAGYDTALTFNPSTDTLKINGAKNNVEVSPTSVRVVSENQGSTHTLLLQPTTIAFSGDNLDEYGSINAQTYTGRATQTEQDLASTTSGSEGATMVGYASNTTVKDALDDIYETIGGGGGSSLTDRVEALETGKQDKLTAGSNISFSGNTINAVDEKVKQSRDTSDTAYPMLLAGTTDPNGSAKNAKYTPFITANPNDKAIEIQGAASAQNPIEKTTITSTGITLHMNEASPQIGASVVSKTGTLTATNYSGTSAQATADGNGNNIVNTYATKAALEALTNQLTSSFQIVTTLPTADGTHGGIIYLIKDQEYGDVNSNIFKEYIEVNDGTTASPSWKFELLGTTDAGVDVVTIPATGSNSVASLFATYVTNA